MLFAPVLWSILGWLAPSPTTVTVDPDTRHQVIAGWEASAGVEWERGLEPFREELFRRAIDEVGINRLRVSVFAGAENTDRSWDRWKSGELTYEEYRTYRYVTRNDNDDPFVIDPAGFDFANLDWRIDNMVLPMQRLLAERGERLFVNLNYVAFTDQSVKDGIPGHYDHDDPEEYAEFVLATYQHMDRKYGFVPDAWEVILEPDLVAEWRRDPGLIGRAMVAAAARLRQAGYTPRFIAPSVTNMKNAVPYLDALLSVPGARDALFEVAYHRYSGTSVANLRAIAAAAARIGRPPAMLELWFGKADTAVLFEDLTTGNNGAWAGRALLGLFQVEDGRLVMPEDTRYTSLYTGFVDRGATRIGATSDSDGAEPLAFLNPDGSLTVAARSVEGGPVTITGLPQGAYRLFWATRDGCAVSVAAPVGADGRAEFELPGAGVFALTSRGPRPPAGQAFLTAATSSRCP